ncbi:MAG: glycosyltransferase family 4 protein [Planctomycetota bacterium]
MSEVEPSVLLIAGRFSVRGSCAYSLRLAEHLPQRGFRTNVVCPDARTLDRERRRELHIDELSHLDWPLWGTVVRSILLRRLVANPPDLIHIQSRAALCQGMWLSRHLQRPFILTVHDYLQPDERCRIDTKWCRRIIAVSDSVRADLLERTPLPENLVTVIHSGVDRASSCDLLKVFKPNRVPVVGTAGPLEAVKGFPFFLGAAARVLATGREVEFLIAGAGPEESNLRRLSRELGINDKVTFVPNLLDFDDALAAMDVFVLPSLQQGIGTIMLDAMAMGRPVIATRVGGVYCAVHDNETGLLVPPSNSEILAERIVELLDDQSKAQAIGSAGRELVERDFGVDGMIDQTAAVYRAVLEHATALQPA